MPDEIQTTTEPLKVYLGTILPMVDESWVMDASTDTPPNIADLNSVVNSKYLWPIRDNHTTPAFAITQGSITSEAWIIQRYPNNNLPAFNTIMMVGDNGCNITDTESQHSIFIGSPSSTPLSADWQFCTVYQEVIGGQKLQFIGGKGGFTEFNGDNSFVTADSMPQLFILPNRMDTPVDEPKPAPYIAIKVPKYCNVKELAGCFCVELPHAEEYNSYAVVPTTVQARTSSSLTGRTTILNYARSLNNYNLTYKWSDDGTIANRLYTLFKLIANNGTPLIVCGQGAKVTNNITISGQTTTTIMTDRQVCDLIMLETMPEIKQINRTSWEVTINGRGQP